VALKLTEDGHTIHVIFSPQNEIHKENAIYEYYIFVLNFLLRNDPTPGSVFIKTMTFRITFAFLTRRAAETLLSYCRS
jgi:hypothetical protein